MHCPYCLITPSIFAAQQIYIGSRNNHQLFLLFRQSLIAPIPCHPFPCRSANLTPIDILCDISEYPSTTKPRALLSPFYRVPRQIYRT